MSKKDKIDKTVGRCIVCEEKVTEYDGSKCNSDNFTFGYGSELDCYQFRIYLCDRCAVEKLARKVIPKMIDIPSGYKFKPKEAASKLHRRFYLFSQKIFKKIAKNV